MEERPLISVLSELKRLNNSKDTFKAYTTAYGPVEIVSWDRESIVVSVEGNYVKLDTFGRLYEKGECILFPTKTKKDWNGFLLDSIFEYHNSLLVSGSVCLFKENQTETWKLGIFNEILKTTPIKYKITRAKQPEEVEFAISFEDNKQYLGLVVPPDWLDLEKD